MTSARIRLAALALSVVTAACADRGAALVSGTIEITETDIAPASVARVLRVTVDEGDTVRIGDTLAVLQQAALPADIEQRRARVRSAQAELRDLAAGARPAELQRAEADLRSAETEAERLQREASRIESLAAAGNVSRSQLDAAQSAAKVASNRRDSARDALRLLREGARPERVQAARAAVDNAQAQLAMAEATAADLVLTAPSAGVVIGRHVEPGEVLPAGMPAVSLGDPRRPWVRVYVDAPTLASIHVGDSAHVIVPGAGGRPLNARVAAIATRAEFTPRVALTEKERADLLFGIKLDVTDSTGTAKAGLPVQVRFFAAPDARRPDRG
jgi:HlyD family secretion protein